MRILLVEDEPTLRAQLRQGLQDAGYAVDEADNGRDAHFLGDTETFDAVVLDLGLPVLDGLSVLKRWRDAGRTMPVLILTARDNWSEKVAGIDAGADDYLTKPFHMEELLARLRALIRRANGQASPVLQCGARGAGHAQRPRHRGRPARHPDQPRIQGARLPDAPPRHAWSRAANSPSTFTRRTSTATPTPSKCSSAACARSCRPS